MLVGIALTATINTLTHFKKKADSIQITFSSLHKQIKKCKNLRKQLK